MIVVASNIAVALFIALLAASLGLWSRSFRVAHLLWFAVLVRLVMPPILSVPFPLPSRHFDTVAMTESVPGPAAVIAGAGKSHISRLRSSETPPRSDIAPRQSVSAPSPIFSWQSALFLSLVAWGVVAAYFLLQGGRRFWMFARLLRMEATVELDATEFVRQQLSTGQKHLLRSVALQPIRCPQVVLLPAKVAPMLFGVLGRTFIVCPAALWSQFTEQQRRVFLTHEVVHYLRGDHWKRWFEWLVCSLYWWCPLVYMARGQLTRFEEIACDEQSLGLLQVSRRCYAETLVRVAEYLDSESGGYPALSNRFVQASLLEERLKLLSSSPQSSPTGAFSSAVGLSFCVAFLMVSPVPFRYSFTTPTRTVSSSVSATSKQSDIHADSPGDVQPPRANELIQLPDRPEGWWTNAPQRQWAHVDLKNGYSVHAEAGVGIELKLRGELVSRFGGYNPACMALLQGGKRIAIGCEDGSVRIWDLADSRSVSLLGRHQAAVTSLAYHVDHGLVVGDAQGSLIQWELDSGAILQTWSSGEIPIESVRFSSDGSSLGVLLGSWDAASRSGQLHCFDLPGFKLTQSQLVSPDAAVALEYRNRWLVADWLGKTAFAFSGEITSTGLRVSKDQVSELAFTQDALPKFDCRPGKQASRKLWVEGQPGHIGSSSDPFAPNHPQRPLFRNSTKPGEF